MGNGFNFYLWKITDSLKNLSAERTQKLINKYLFEERKPMRDKVLDLLNGEQPSVLKRKSIGERILNKIVQYVETFMEGMGG